MRASPRLADVSLLLGAIALAYFNALVGPFQFDDYVVIVDASAVHSLAAWWADLGHGLRPMLKLSYLLDWSLGLGPAGFHATNLLLHVANTVLVWLLAQRAAAAWLAQCTPPERRFAAVAVALLFALHPAQTEAVTYISGRSVSLMCLFYLLALQAWLRGHGWLSLLLFPLALAVKEPAATLPLALWLCDRFGLGRTPAPAAASRLAAGLRYLPFWLLLIGLGLAMAPDTNYRGFLLGSLGVRTIGDNLLSQIGAVFYLLRLALLRTPNLDPDLAEASGWSGLLALQLALLLAALLGALRLRRARPWLAFGLLWFFLQLLPTNSVLPRSDLVNDRQLYFSGLGLALALVFEIAARGWLLPGRAQLRFAGVCALVLATLTHLRNRDYASEIALWRATAIASPQKARPLNNLGYAYQLAGCREQALEAYRRALQRDPQDAKAQQNLRALESVEMPRRQCS